MTTSNYEELSKLLYQAVPQALSDDHKQSLNARIKFGNEYSLRKRLKLILTNILSPYRPIVDRIVGNHNFFVDKLVVTRNYLTHYPEDSDEQPITDPGEQQRFVHKMKLLMQLCLLVELGLPKETVEKLWSNRL